MAPPVQETEVKKALRGTFRPSRLLMQIHKPIQPAIDKTAHPAGAAAFVKAKGDWKDILGFLLRYYQRNRSNPHTVVLARQMVEIGYRSSNSSFDPKGWSGGFVLFVFKFAVDEMRKRPTDWDFPPGTDSHTLQRHNSPADITFSAQIVGDMHFDRHLRPAFNRFIGGRLRRITRSGDADRISQLKSFLRNVTRQHEGFIKYAVLPGFNSVEELWGTIRFVAQSVVEGRARSLRKQIIFNTLARLHQRGFLTEAEVRSLLPHANIHTLGTIRPY